MQRLSMLVLVTLVGCSGAPQRATTGPEEAFARQLLRALTRDDTAAWEALLSQRMRSQLGADQASLHDHLAAWRRELLPLAPAIAQADLAVDAAGVVTFSVDGEEPQALASVVLEGGALRLDER